MTEQVHRTICQACQMHCALLATVSNGEVVKITGDKDDPVYHGYSCIKGRTMAEAHRLPSRLRHSMRRLPNGSFAPVDPAIAATEIGGKLQAIRDRHGPRAIAMSIGTYGYCNFTAQAFALAFMQALGSPMVFSPQTIDQPGKGIAAGLHGAWLGGTPAMDSWEVLLLVGCNPLVSMNGGLGPNPARALKQARQRGMKLIVIDPRASDTAQQADLHLQCRPGEDAAILAGIARELLRTGQIDADFVCQETLGLEALRIAVEPFTPDHVAARAGIPADQIVAAAAMLGAARWGGLSAGTGANMSGESAVTEYLISVLASLRGWWRRAGETRLNPGVLIQPMPPIAAASGPSPAFGFGEKMRVRGLTATNMNLPTAALADEILLPGEGQVKALIVVGGNPVAAWPDQIKTDEAMQALDLLVCLDPRVTHTARHAHYILAPKLQFEIETNTAMCEHTGMFGYTGWGYEEPYGLICPPLVDPPAGSQLIEEWEAFYAIAQAMSLPLSIRSLALTDPAAAEAEATRLDMVHKPSPRDVWKIVLKGSPIAYDSVAAAGGPQLYPRTVVLQPKPADWTARLDIAAVPILEDLRDIAARPARHGGDLPFRLISRRMHDFHNSNWQDNKAQQRSHTTNPAFMHPEDLDRIGAREGDIVTIRSARATVRAVAGADPAVRPGCVSIAHAWGLNPGDEEDPRVHGASTARLSVTDRDYDRYSGIPLMSAIPVDVRLASGDRS